MTYAEHADRILPNIKNKLSELIKLQNNIELMEIYEDGIYRFYHQSFKVYSVQTTTMHLVMLFTHIGRTSETDEPEDVLCKRFMDIIHDGVGHVFTMEANSYWEQETRPILEAFLHAKYFLDMMVKYGTELEEAPQCMPFGWAAILSLYQMQ